MYASLPGLPTTAGLYPDYGYPLRLASLRYSRCLAHFRLLPTTGLFPGVAFPLPWLICYDYPERLPRPSSF